MDNPSNSIQELNKHIRILSDFFSHLEKISSKQEQIPDKLIAPALEFFNSTELLRKIFYDLLNEKAKYIIDKEVTEDNFGCLHETCSHLYFSYSDVESAEFCGSDISERGFELMFNFTGYINFEKQFGSDSECERDGIPAKEEEKFFSGVATFQLDDELEFKEFIDIDLDEETE